MYYKSFCETVKRKSTCCFCKSFIYNGLRIYDLSSPLSLLKSEAQLPWGLVLA